MKKFAIYCLCFVSTLCAGYFLGSASLKVPKEAANMNVKVAVSSHQYTLADPQEVVEQAARKDLGRLSGAVELSILQKKFGINDETDFTTELAKIPQDVVDAKEKVLKKVLLLTWISSDPRAALEWIYANESHAKYFRRFIALGISIFAETDIKGAITSLADIPDKGLRLALSEQYIDALAKTDFEFAREWVEEQTDEKLVSGARERLTLLKASEKPEEFIEQLVSGEIDVDAGIINYSAYKAGNALAIPEGSFERLQSLKNLEAYPEKIQTEIAAAYVSRVSLEYAAEVEEWIASLPKNNILRDTAVVSLLVGKKKHENLYDSLTLAASVSDPEQKNLGLKSVVDRWVYNEPEHREQAKAEVVSEIRLIDSITDEQKENLLRTIGIFNTKS